MASVASTPSPGLSPSTSRSASPLIEESSGGLFLPPSLGELKKGDPLLIGRLRPSSSLNTSQRLLAEKTARVKSGVDNTEYTGALDRFERLLWERLEQSLSGEGSFPEQLAQRDLQTFATDVLEELDAALQDASATPKQKIHLAYNLCKKIWQRYEKAMESYPWIDLSNPNDDLAEKARTILYQKMGLNCALLKYCKARGSLKDLESGVDELLPNAVDAQISQFFTEQRAALRNKAEQSILATIEKEGLARKVTVLKGTIEALEKWKGQLTSPVCDYLDDRALFNDLRLKWKSAAASEEIDEKEKILGALPLKQEHIGKEQFLVDKIAQRISELEEEIKQEKEQRDARSKSMRERAVAAIQFYTSVRRRAPSS